MYVFRFSGTGFLFPVFDGDKKTFFLCLYVCTDKTGYATNQEKAGGAGAPSSAQPVHASAILKGIL